MPTYLARQQQLLTVTMPSTSRYAAQFFFPTQTMLRSTKRLRDADKPSTQSSEAKLSSLERWKAISSIASAIAIPFVLAIVGYFIQRQLAEEGIKKDYVLIATNILKENPANQEPDLRKWAVEMLDSNSPIPFSKRAKEGLEKGIFLIVPPPRIPGPPEGCMKPPRPSRVGPLVQKFDKQGIADTVEMAKQYGQLLTVALDAEHEAALDRASLACLQRYGNLVKEWDEQIAEMHKKPVSQWPPAPTTAASGP